MTALELINSSNNNNSNNNCKASSNSNSNSANNSTESSTNTPTSTSVVDNTLVNSSLAPHTLFINKFSKKYHLNRYKQEQEQEQQQQQQQQQKQLLTATPPHSPSTSLHSSPSNSKSLMIIDCKRPAVGTVVSSDLVVESIKRENLKDINSNLIEHAKVDGDTIDIIVTDVSGQKLDDSSELLNATTVSRTNSVGIVAMDAEEESELPIIQTPPQSTASSISLNDISSTITIVTTSATTLGKESHESDAKRKKLDRESLKLQIDKRYESLKSNFKNSYSRLRRLQTKHFQYLIEEQLNSLAQLNERTSEESESTTTTTTSVELDKKRIDLLTSILKSNLVNKDDLSPVANENTPPTTSSVVPSSTAAENDSKCVTDVVKSLIDDIQYELSKQNEERSLLRQQKKLNKLVDQLDSADSTSDDETDSDSDESNIDLSDLDLDVLRPLNESLLATDYKNSILLPSSSSSSNGNKQTTTTTTIKNTANSDDNKKLADRSNWFWNMKRVQTGNEWERVQCKIKYLELKNKQCNDYLNKQNKLIDQHYHRNVKNNNNNNNLNEQTSTSIITTTATSNNSKTNPKSSDPTITTIASGNETDHQKAIAALEESLQECIVAAVSSSSPSPSPQQLINNSKPVSSTSSTITLNNTKNEKSGDISMNEKAKAKEVVEEVVEMNESTSRCVQQPYHMTKSRLFNLNKSDLVSFDDETLKSIYLTFAHLNKNMFKTTCWCSNSTVKSNQLESVQASIRFKRNKQHLANASSQLAQTKTCIFCHLLKKYENNRSDNRMRARNGRAAAKNENLSGDNTTSNGKKLEHSANQSAVVPLTDKSNENSALKQNQDLIKKDHSYCKVAALSSSLPSKKKRTSSDLSANSATSPPLEASGVNNSKTNANKKRKLSNNNSLQNHLLFDKEDELLDELVKERLNRLFDSCGKSHHAHDSSNKKSLFDDANEFYDLNLGQQRLDHDQLFIDAGMDIDPSEITKLPDLTYEELEFLNNDTENCISFSRQNNRIMDLNGQCEENFNNIVDVVGEDPNNSNPNQQHYVYADNLYRPSYKSIISSYKKRRRQQQQQQIVQLEPNQAQRNTQQQTKRKLALVNRILNQQSAEDAFKKCRLISSLNKSDSKTINLLRDFLNENEKSSMFESNDQKMTKCSKANRSSKTVRKRNRSNGSYSSLASSTSTSLSSLSSSPSNSVSSANSCSMLAAESVAGDQLKTGSNAVSTGHYIYANSQIDKFDINNIVIPIEMITNCRVVSTIRREELPTPKWRAVDTNDSNCCLHGDESVAPTSSEIEECDDLVYERRHEFHELKGRFEIFVKQNKEKKKNASSAHKRSPARDDSASKTEADLFELGERLIHLTPSQVNEKHLHELRRLLLKLELEQQQQQQRKRNRLHSSSESTDKVCNQHLRNADTDNESSDPGESNNKLKCVKLTEAHKRRESWPTRQFPLSEQDYATILSEDVKSEQCYFQLFQLNLRPSKPNGDHQLNNKQLPLRHVDEDQHLRSHQAIVAAES